MSLPRDPTSSKPFSSTSLPLVPVHRPLAAATGAWGPTYMSCVHTTMESELFLVGFDIVRCLPVEPQAAGRWMTRQVSKLGDRGRAFIPSVSAETEPEAAALP